MVRPAILILGTRGIPASHGGFETFAEKLSLFLVERGWHVVVYCQHEVTKITQRASSRMWRGVELLDIQVSSTGPRASLEFDGHCARHAATRDGVCLVLGYNGAIFLPFLRLAGKKILTNMDGIEWRRPKWNYGVKFWFWVNERIAALSSHRLVADHPAIADHIATRRNRDAIAMIPYGGDPVLSASQAPLKGFGIGSGQYFISVARIEPDNSILPIVEGFSRKPRGMKLVILGTLLDEIKYHRNIRAAASDEVIFAGAIYDPEIVSALRFHARAYLHGHTVGGTNPSLVEALWAGNAVIAHDNKYNRWTAHDAGVYFDDTDGFEKLIEAFITDDETVARAKQAARIRAAAQFDWADVLLAYEREIIGLADISTASVREIRDAGRAALP